MATGTVAERIYAVRLALGDGVRKPLPLRRFAALLSERAAGERNFSPSQLSTWETGAAVPQLGDIAMIAAADPKKRGAGWLAFGDASAGGSAHEEGRPLGAPLPMRQIDVETPRGRKRRPG